MNNKKLKIQPTNLVNSNIAKIAQIFLIDNKGKMIKMKTSHKLLKYTSIKLIVLKKYFENLENKDIK